MYILGVALAAAAVNTDVSASVYGGSVVSDSEGRFQDSFPRGVSHESLLAQAHKQPKGLLRPLRFYIMPFMEWAVEHKVAFDSVEDAVHGLKVRTWDKCIIICPCLYNVGDRLYQSSDDKPPGSLSTSRGIFSRRSTLCTHA